MLRSAAPAVLLTVGALSGAAPDALGEAARTETAVASTSPVGGATETLVRVRAPLPASFGARPPACDWLSYLRYRAADGPADSADADRLLVARQRSALAHPVRAGAPQPRDDDPAGRHFPGDTGRLYSIAGHITTVQAQRAATLSGGTAVVVSPGEADEWFARLCDRGHVWERSSVTVFAAYDRLRVDGVIGAGEHTVLVATSHFFKGL
ncbi:hypothetical protein SAMN04487981_13520 [Streptomyces sp. cf386]|nr:hypothetical protein SAMN04487981_13520 [Streptomyces sp. cf386]